MHNCVKNLPVRNKIAISTKFMIFDGFVKVRESLFTRVIIWFNSILNHIDTRIILLGMKILALYMDPGHEWYWKQKYQWMPTPYSYQKKGKEILVIDIQMV